MSVELELISKIMAQRSLKKDLQALSTNYKKNMDNLEVQKSTNISQAKNTCLNDLETNLALITEKYDSKIANNKELTKQQLSDLKSKELYEKDQCLASSQDQLNEFDELMANTVTLETNLKKILGSKTYNAYLDVFTERSKNTEIVLENCNDYIETANVFKSSMTELLAINPRNPDTIVLALARTISAPIRGIKSLFSDKSVHYIIDLILLNILTFLLIKYNFVLFTLLLGFTIVSVALAYYQNNKVYTNFNNYYLIYNNVNNLKEGYKQALYDESLSDSILQIRNEAKRTKKRLKGVIHDLNIAKESDINEFKNNFNLDERVNSKLKEIETKYIQDKESTHKKFSDYKDVLSKSKDELDDEIALLRDTATQVPAIPNSSSIVDEYPTAYIGYKYNKEYDFDTVVELPIEDSSYLIICNEEDKEVVNQTVKQNIVRFHKYYRPQAISTTIIDSVTLGSSVADIQLDDSDYMEVKTNLNDANNFLQKVQEDMPTRNKLIYKEFKNILEYNKAMDSMNGIIMPFKIIYLLNYNNTAQDDTINVIAQQQNIGYFTVMVTSPPKDKSDFEQADYNKMVSSFKHVIDLTCSPVTYDNEPLAELQL